MEIAVKDKYSNDHNLFEEVRTNQLHLIGNGCRWLLDTNCSEKKWHSPAGRQGRDNAKTNTNER